MTFGLGVKASFVLHDVTSLHFATCSTNFCILVAKPQQKGDRNVCVRATNTRTTFPTVYADLAANGVVYATIKCMAEEK